MVSSQGRAALDPQSVAGSPRAQQRFLHDVLRNRPVASQPVGKAQQIRTHRFEQSRDGRVRVRCGQPPTN